MASLNKRASPISEVVEAMHEVGVDLAHAKTIRLTQDVATQGQMLITMGCGDQCPVVPGLLRDDWSLEDPKGRPIERVREIRDEIRQRVELLLDRKGWLGSVDEWPVARRFRLCRPCILGDSGGLPPQRLTPAPRREMFGEFAPK